MRLIDSQALAAKYQETHYGSEAVVIDEERRKSISFGKLFTAA
jgi:hypothetical protein